MCIIRETGHRQNKGIYANLTLHPCGVLVAVSWDKWKLAFESPRCLLEFLPSGFWHGHWGVFQAGFQTVGLPFPRGKCTDYCLVCQSKRRTWRMPKTTVCDSSLCLLADTWHAPPPKMSRTWQFSNTGGTSTIGSARLYLLIRSCWCGSERSMLALWDCAWVGNRGNERGSACFHFPSNFFHPSYLVYLGAKNVWKLNRWACSFSKGAVMIYKYTPWL